MTNEELAAAIQEGREDLYPALWDQVKAFVAQQAWNRYCATGGYGGVEVEDLKQSGFLALVEAVGYYNPATECSFLTILGNCLKTAFARAGGYRTTKRDPLNNCRSLDAPRGDDPESDSLEELLADERDDIEAAENKIYREQLCRKMDAAVSDLPAEQMETLYRIFVRGQTFEEIGSAAGVKPQAVRAWEFKALSLLRTPRQARELEQFLDERTDFYTRVGIKGFRRTGESAVEKLAIKRDAMARRFA